MYDKRLLWPGCFGSIENPVIEDLATEDHTGDDA